MRTRQTILALAAAALLLPASTYAKPRSKEDAENKANYKACMAEAGHDPKAPTMTAKSFASRPLASKI